MSLYDEVCKSYTQVGHCKLVTTCWSGSQVYAVSADWSEASCQVLAYGDGDWYCLGMQVADFKHKPINALRHVLMLEAAYSDGDESDAIDSALQRSIRC